MSNKEYAKDIIWDVLVGHGYAPTEKACDDMYTNLSADIKCLAEQWGWSDTEVRSQIYEYVSSLEE